MAVKELENRIKSAVNSLKRPGGIVDMTWLEEESSESSEGPSPEPTPEPTPDPEPEPTPDSNVTKIEATIFQSNLTVQAWCKEPGSGLEVYSDEFHEDKLCDSSETGGQASDENSPARAYKEMALSVTVGQTLYYVVWNSNAADVEGTVTVEAGM